MRFPWRVVQIGQRMGWYWIGRIRNRDMVSPADGDTWRAANTLSLATPRRSHSVSSYVRNHPVSCRLVLIKRTHQGRHKKAS